MNKVASEKRTRSKIARLFIVRTLIFSGLVTVVATTLLLARDYRQGLASIDAQIEQIRESHLESLTSSVWFFEDNMIQLQLDGLLRFPDVEHLAISVEGEVKWKAGESITPNSRSIEFPLVYRLPTEEKQLGVLRIFISQEGVYRNLLETALTILVSVAILIFAMAGAILFLFQQLVTRHLEDMTRYTETISFDKNAPPLVLDPSPLKTEASYELSELSDAINSMRAKLAIHMDDLRESEERFQDMAANVPGIVFQFKIDAQGQFSFPYISPTITGILGLNAADVAENADELFNRTHPDDRARLFGSIKKSHQTLEYWNWEGRALLVSGEVIWLQGASIPRKLTDGSVLWNGLLIDTTEHKLADEALLESERKYRRIIDTTSEGYWYIDEVEKTQEVNAAICAILGFAPEEMFGKSPLDFVDEENQEILEAHMHRKAKSEHRSTEITFKAKDGRDVPMLVNATNVRNAAGNLTGSFAFLSDLTEAKQIEHQLVQTQKMEAVGVLAGGIAHDFNNIISAILGHSHLACEEIPDGNMARVNLEHIQNAGNRAANLVQQLLAFGRRNGATKEPIRLDQVVTEVMDLLRASIPSTITIESDFDTPSGVIAADSTQLHQVIMNLVSNAVDAVGREKGTIQVTVKEAVVGADGITSDVNLPNGEYVTLSIADTGCGMDAETLARVFDPFFTTKRVGKGTGLGLSAVHGIVEAHEGAIRVDSRLGEGTTITIFFPVEESSEPSDPRAVKTEPDARGDERVLLVDDDDSVIDMIGSLLRRYGYTVDAMTDSTAAHSCYCANPGHYNLLITDQIMPEMTGDVLARELLAISPELPVILCTGYHEALSEEEAKGIGIREIALKPIDPVKFPHLVRRILDQEPKES